MTSYLLSYLLLFNAFVLVMFTSAVEFSGCSHSNYIKKKKSTKIILCRCFKCKTAGCGSVAKMCVCSYVCVCVLL